MKLIRLTDSLGYLVALVPSKIVGITYDPETDQTYIITEHQGTISINGNMAEVYIERVEACLK